jgi:histone-lysine N-methyltransferase SETD3
MDESFSRFPIDRFVETRLLVCSRVFGIVVDRVKTDAMVPLADMLNHHLPKQTSWYYCDSSNGFVIQSLQEISVGA